MALSRHTKLALVVAPFLAVIGWIASDIWIESQAMKDKFFTLEPDAGYCDVLAKKCILSSGDFQISLYEEDGFTTLNSTYPLDTATLFLVEENDNITAYQMGMKDSPYYWYKQTYFKEKNLSQGSKQKIRIIAKIKGGQYIGEFVSTTLAADLN